MYFGLVFIIIIIVVVIIIIIIIIILRALLLVAPAYSVRVDIKGQESHRSHRVKGCQSLLSKVSQNLAQ